MQKYQEPVSSISKHDTAFTESIHFSIMGSEITEKAYVYLVPSGASAEVESELAWAVDRQRHEHVRLKSLLLKIILPIAILPVCIMIASIVALMVSDPKPDIAVWGILVSIVPIVVLCFVTAKIENKLLKVASTIDELNRKRNDSVIEYFGSFNPDALVDLITPSKRDSLMATYETQGRRGFREEMSKLAAKAQYSETP